MIVPPTWISKRKAFTHRTTDSFTRLVRRIDCHIFVKPKVVPGVLDSTSLTYALPLSTYGILSGRASLAMLDLLRDADIELKSATDCVSRLLCRCVKRWEVLAANILEFNRPACHAIAIVQDPAGTYSVHPKTWETFSDPRSSRRDWTRRRLNVSSATRPCRFSPLHY